MKTFFLLLLPLLLGFGSCASNSIYYWGHYQDLLYDQYQTPGKSTPEIQVLKLEEDIEVARSKNKPLPPGFFARSDESPDEQFYSFDRLVTHIDAGAIAAVGSLYDELELTGDVLDVCSSWVSHFRRAPARLVAIGMNAVELAANPMASSWEVSNLNAEPVLPFDDASFDAVTCCVSVDYLTKPLHVFAEVARVLRPGGTFVCTFSNRCFPTKAVRGWLATDDAGRCAIVKMYFRMTDGFGEPVVEHRNPGARTDPLYGVWARRMEGPSGSYGWAK